MTQRLPKETKEGLVINLLHNNIACAGWDSLYYSIEFQEKFNDLDQLKGVLAHELGH
jgi:hypothetical protein